MSAALGATVLQSKNRQRFELITPRCRGISNLSESLNDRITFDIGYDLPDIRVLRHTEASGDGAADKAIGCLFDFNA